MKGRRVAISFPGSEAMAFAYSIKYDLQQTMNKWALLTMWKSLSSSDMLTKQHGNSKKSHDIFKKR